MEGKEKRGVIVQSVARALTMISCFANDTELGISEIAERMDLSKSTTYGLVNTLTAFGYLEQTENKKYRLGLKLFELGNLVQSRMDVRMEARPYCQLLADKYRTTVHLATHSEGEIIYIDKVDNNSSVVVYSQIGKRAPMYCTGVGKAILAFLPEEYMEKYVLSRPLIKMTEHTITTGDRLLKELEQVRERGYAVDDEEIEPGLTVSQLRFLITSASLRWRFRCPFHTEGCGIWIGSRPFGMSYIMLSRHRSASGTLNNK